MGRTRTVTWDYMCDEPSCPVRGALKVVKGDREATGRSLVVNDQSDADAVARREGWTVGTRVTCPSCVGGGA